MTSSIRANRAFFLFSFSVALAVGGFSTPMTIAQQCWIERVPPLPTLPPHGSDSVGMAFDSARNVAVLFEYDETVQATRTLEWDGTTWHEREVGTGPSRRYGFRMVYDPIRQVTVFFGGGINMTKFNDTWIWDGVQWTQVSNSGPSPRSAHSIAWDPRHGGVLLHGGVVSTGHSQETWVWNGDAWSLESAGGPPSFDAAMAFDESREEMILFGGVPGASSLDDTWIWNMNSWSQRSSTGPSRQYHSMVFFNGTIFLFGGQLGNQVLDDTWIWDGITWSEVMVSGPSARRLYAMTVDTQRQRVVLFGGRRVNSFEPLFDDTWEWDGTQWKEMSWVPGFQSLRGGLAYDSFRGVTMLFGGSSGRSFEDPDLSDDLAEWDGNQWKKVSHGGPVARQRFAMAYRPYPTQPGGFLIIQGGEDGNGGPPFNDYSIYAGSGWGSSPSGLQNEPGNAMVFDTWRDTIVMFDGWTRLFPLMGGWITADVANPPYRTDHAMAFDSERGVAVLFGGVVFNGPLQGDTWEWDGSSWALRSTTGPSPRKFHAMAYDEVLRKTVLFGGEGANGDLGDTWTWDGNAWEEMTISGPSARSGHRMAYDSNRDRIVLFGGPLGSTWEFASSCPSGFNNRFLTMSSEGIYQPTALRVTLTSLHHPDPANGGAPDFSAFEGQVRWAGPAVLENESSTNPAVVYASFLQCSPHYQLWTPSRLLQLTGSAIVPSSKYQVEWLAASCMGQESTCTDILRTASFITTRWGDVIPSLRPPSNSVQPDISDVAALVDKFKGVAGAPVKAQTLLAGTAPFGHVNIEVDVDFGQVSACVDAFRGMAYPYTIEACP